MSLVKQIVFFMVGGRSRIWREIMHVKLKTIPSKQPARK